MYPNKCTEPVGQYPSPSSIKEVSKFEMASDKVYVALNRLEEIIDYLYKHFNSILNIDTRPTCENDKVAGYSCDFERFICNTVDRIDTCSNKLNDFSERSAI